MNKIGSTESIIQNLCQNLLFNELLQNYQVNQKITPLIKLQLTKLFDHYNNGSDAELKKLQPQQEKIKQQIRQLKIRNGLGEIDKETYGMTNNPLTTQMVVTGKVLIIYLRVLPFRSIQFSIIIKFTEALVSGRAF